MIQINRDPTTRQLRWFAALVFPAFALWIAWLLHAAGLERVGAVVVVAALILSAIGLISPPFMRWVWLGIMYAVFPIGWVMSHLLLGVVYYLAVVPIGLALRIAGRDAMNRSLEREEPTYWIDRRARPDVERYFRQY